MTYTLTADQYTDMLSDLGLDDTADPPPFSKGQLDRLFDRADGEYALTVVYAIRQMLARAHKFHTYFVGPDQVNKQQIFQNLKDLLKTWEDIAGVGGGSLSAGTLSLGLDTTEDDLTEWST